ncbi:hypothetical protein CQW49_06005 [Methylosinus trichosporium OB3b]|uniref:Uncharacterized protein n=1 Tax=Methylosinus trichosporium (strain ATCC 35070 / NCIMB 11131 / UNIQEM 75 / OB3b) TaxID=595536 RepID=A0A2D2D5H2_METT3|nr:hypothetical protein CQW49_06005 [Methylosinus trichosporium OB3b]OBS51479.1 hypothetical protein A8B73_16250 [Methylosinus sp. 3S-1]
MARRGDGGARAVAFDVVVREAKSETHHRVTISRELAQKLGGGVFDAEQCLDAAFRFLLDREPKEQILGRFDVSVISLYFPEFERELPKYLG